MKVPGYLGQRREGWEAVVDVPPSLRAAVGRKRLRKGLGTKDKHVAKARLAKAVLELHSRIDEARRAAPALDPLTAEALALREQHQAEARGELDRFLPVIEVFDPDTGQMTDAVERGFTTGIIAERAEELERRDGTARAKHFVDMAHGLATPLLLHRDTWLAEPGKRGVRRERTSMEFRGILQAFAEWLVKERVTGTVEAVSRAVAGRYLGHLHQSGRSPKRVRDVASALSGYWQWLVRRGHIAEGMNPWTRQEVGGGGEGWTGDDARSFTADELRRLLTGDAAPHDKELMHLLALTGMRIEEAAKLRVGDCAGGTFTVRSEGRGAKRTGKTKAMEREVPVHPDLALMVEHRTTGKGVDAWLFPELGKPDKYGRRSPTADARLNRYREKLGIVDRPEGAKRSRVTVHSFRRWFITEALRAKQPERVVKQVVGHKLPKHDPTVGIYHDGDLLPALRECVEAVKLPPLAGPASNP